LLVLPSNNDNRNRTPNLIENSVVAPENRKALERTAFVCTVARAVGRRLLGGIAIAAAGVTMWYHFLLID
jgi:hypothetical protein